MVVDLLALAVVVDVVVDVVVVVDFVVVVVAPCSNPLFHHHTLNQNPLPDQVLDCH